MPVSVLSQLQYMFILRVQYGGSVVGKSCFVHLSDRLPTYMVKLRDKEHNPLWKSARFERAHIT